MICQHCQLEIEDSSGVYIHSKSRKNWCKGKAGEPIFHANPIGEKSILPTIPLNRKHQPPSDYKRGYNTGYISGKRAARKEYEEKHA